MRHDLDRTGRRIAAALMAAPRAPWRAIADCLGLSERTVARHAGPLLGEGTVRTSVVRNPDCFRRLVPMVLRIRCRPGHVAAVASTLAHRNDSIWVDVLGGGDELNAAMLLDGPVARDTLLLHDLPATPAVRSWSAQLMMRVFPAALRWTGDVLTAEEIAALPRQPHTDPARPHQESALDAAFIRALTNDGRATYSHLAEAAGTTATTARRRVETLIRDQVIRPAAEMDLALLGAHAEALLWMNVEPGGLTRTAQALCAQSEVRFVAATTGATNLFVAVAAADLAGMYRFLTETVGSLEQIKEIETTPILRTVLRTGLRRHAPHDRFRPVARSVD